MQSLFVPKNSLWHSFFIYNFADHSLIRFWLVSNSKNMFRTFYLQNFNFLFSAIFCLSKIVKLEEIFYYYYYSADDDFQMV